MRGVTAFDVGRVLWPAGLPMLAAVVCLVAIHPQIPDEAWWSAGPHVCFGIGSIILARLNCGRALAGCVGLWVSSWLVMEASSSDTQVLAALVALSAILATLLPDHGIKSWLTAVGFLPTVAMSSLNHWPSVARAEFETWLAFAALPDWPIPSDLAEGVLVAHVVACAALLYRALRTHSPSAAGLFVAFGSWLAFIHSTGENQSVLFLAMGATVCLLALETSHALAFVDELTGLPGRRALEHALRGLGSSYTLAMVDIDHFKKFNDKHGHDAGDEVLRMVAARLRAVGQGGRAFRYGGEEFTIVFAGRELAQVRDTLEALRQSIGESPFVIRSPDRPPKKPKKAGSSKGRGRIKLTVSIGAAMRDDSQDCVEAVMKLADKRLYQAKKKGRNRVVS